MARRRGLQAEGMLKIKLSRSGELLSYSLKEKFDYAIFDRAIMRMVKKSAPFPAFPKHIDKDSFEFVVPVEFALR